MTAPPSDNLAAPPRRRRRRWWLRIPLSLIALIVVIVVLAQAFLWTDYPRRIAETQVERILRVRTTIRAVSIGWLGQTRIEGVTLTLPFESEPFAKIARIDATHASLPLIAFTQDLRDVRVDGVELIARQNADGRWNLEQLRSPPSTTQPTQVTNRPSNPLADLPSLHASDVRASLIRADGTRLDLPPVEVDFRKRDSLVATVSAHAGETLSVDGEIGQTLALPQVLNAKFTGLPPGAAEFFGMSSPPAVTASIEWRGRLTADGVAGSLQILNARASELRLAGRVEVEAGKRISARPTGLEAKIDNGATLDLNATSGAITYDGGIAIDGLGGTLNGGRFALDGTFDPRALAADVSAKWEAVTRDALATTGSAHVRTSRMFNGRIRIDADARGGAKVAAGEAVGALNISGEAESLSLASFGADLTLDPFTWTPSDQSPPIVTPRLTGDISGAEANIRVEAHSADDPAGGSLSAFGGFDRAAKTWWATLDASRLLLPAIESRGIKGPVDVSLAADGTTSVVHVSRAYAKLDRGTAYATGEWNRALPRPLSATAWAWYEKPVTEDEAAELSSVRAEAKIEGTLAPRDLKADVDLQGSELVLAGRPVGDLSLKVAASCGEDEAAIRSQELEALGGKWSLRGRWSRKEGGPPVVFVRFRDIPAANLGAAIGRDDLGGMIQNGSAIIRLPSSRLDRIEATATARGSQLSAGPFRAELLVLEANLHHGRFEITPELHEQDGIIAAKIVGDVMLKSPVHADVTLENWPAPYLVSTSAGAERFRPRASGKASADASVRTGDVSAELSLGGTVERGESKLADFRIEGALKDKLVTLSKVRLDTLDGTLEATASADLRDPNATHLDATFNALTPAQLAWSNPIIGEVNGRLNGSFAIRPSADPRALGPLEIELKVQPDGVSFRKVAIGDLDVLAHADVKSASEFRVVTDHAVLNIAGGTIEPFARLSSEPTRGMAQLLTAQFKGLDLGQIGKAVDDDGKELIGKVGGRVQVYGQTTRLATLAGDASIDITQSDLVNFGPIAFLYNALSIGTAGSKPIGTGNISLRFGGDVLTIDDATYFNRGVYANAFGPIRGLSKGTGAEVDRVLVVGSLQPLRAVKLPFFGDVSDTLSALGSSLTAVEVTGTAKEPKMALTTIGAIGETLQKVLLGKTRGDK